MQEAANSSNSDLSALGKFALAALYREENKGPQAVDLYKKLIEKPTLVVSKATAQLELAGYYETQGKPDEAKKIYDQVQKENPATEAASVAQRRSSAALKLIGRPAQNSATSPQREFSDGDLSKACDQAFAILRRVIDVWGYANRTSAHADEDFLFPEHFRKLFRNRFLSPQAEVVRRP